MSRSSLKFFLIVILMCAVPMFTYATVEPLESQLIESSGLVIVGHVKEVKVLSSDSVQGKGSITIRVYQVAKGKYHAKDLTLIDFFGGKAKGDKSQAQWLKQWSDFKNNQHMLKFYLRGTSKNSKESFWVLSDAWFGYKVIKE